jgi:hypothetical protein
MLKQEKLTLIKKNSTMTTTTSPQLFLPLNFNQIFDLVNQLPTLQKKELANLLLQEETAALDAIPEAQKKFVRNSIKKYKEQPQLLISEKEAWDKIG